MLPYIAEFLGAMILITLDDGIVANVTLNKSGMKGAGSIQITFAWGLVVMLSAFIFGAAPGAHSNPALTIVLAVDGNMVRGLVPGYIVAQSVGALVGAVIVYLLFKDQHDAVEPAAIKLGIFRTGPPVPNMECNILSEAVGTFVFVFVIEGIGQVTGIVPGVDKLPVFGTVVSIGTPLGGLTGYTVNPICDLGPCFAHTALPIKGKGDSNWGYVSAVIIGSVMGVVVVMLLYQAIPWM